MRLAILFHQPSAKIFWGLSVCFLSLILLADSNPVRKKRASAGHNNSSRAAMPRNSSYVAGQHRGDARQSNDLKFVPLKKNGRPNAMSEPYLVIAKPLAVGVKSPSTENNKAQIPQNPPPPVGQLPPQPVIPLPIESNGIHDKRDLPRAKGNHSQSREQEGGVAVGVGAMNRDRSKSTKSHQVYHKGPDNSLDIGAADRKGPKGDISKELQQNADQLMLAAHDEVKRDEDSLNPALQQPPPQAREPPLDQIRKKETHLGPIKSKQGIILSGRSDLQDEKQTKRPAGDFSNNDIRKVDKHVIEMVKEPVKLAELNPPDHMEGIRMEKDGHLNRDYRKEIFIGHHEEFEWTDEEKVSAKLKYIFRRANSNNDGFLDQNEIQEWITKNVRVHLDDAARDNSKVFRHLDANKDGLVSWTEFYTHFLIAKGYVLSAKDALSNISLEVEDNERIVKYKYRWSEANEDSDNDKLDIKEMLNFRHPEQSKRMISELVKDLVNNLDRNGDGVITEKEFVALPRDIDGEPPLPMEESWQKERRKEFKDVIDLNKDGKADMAELKIYFDPYNVNHARLEAENLIKMADQDDDGKLTIEEILDSTDLFVGSKMVDAKRKLHDEF